ncbi:MAG TPA: hypothetical protein P5089_02320 [Candidatus Portnoybacteria bacterium]|nr:hypothetical protein [Candidatus Portnoybacteria bacterium]
MERLLLFAEGLFEKRVSLDYFSLYMLALIICAFAFIAIFVSIQNKRNKKSKQQTQGGNYESRNRYSFYSCDPGTGKSSDEPSQKRRTNQ